MPPYGDGRNMEERKCKNCGAPLERTGPGRWRCEYCGSVYEVQSSLGEIQFIEAYRPEVQKLAAQVMLDRDALVYMPPEDLRKYTLGQLRQQLAEGIEAFMKVTSYEDPLGRGSVIRGEVRVIPADKRF